MNIKIITDSTCDLPVQLLAEHNIALTPLTVVKGDEQFKDGVTITPEEGATPANIYLKAENVNSITKVLESEAIAEGVTFDISDVADDDIAIYIWEDNLKPVTLPFVK